MGAKITAALNAVKPGSECTACVVASGSDYNAVRSILGKKYEPCFGSPKGTLFATPNTALHRIGSEETKIAVRIFVMLS
jgi:delta-1-pyrroline-5-carboxylate synthetase